MGLRDTLALGKLGLALRKIWHKDKVITVPKLRKSFNLVWEFITGKKLSDGDEK